MSRDKLRSFKESMVPSFKSGYDGEDSMRSKAEKLFGGEMAVPMEKPRSDSAQGKVPMRRYATGGHVKAENPKAIERADVEAGHKANRLNAPYPKKLSNPKANNLSAQTRSLANASVEGVRKADRADEGFVKKGSNPKTPKLSAQSERELNAFKKGGHVVKKGAGGPIDSKQALSYEKDMKGTMPVISKAKNSGKLSNKEPFDASDGTIFKKGGCIKRAMGGAAKVRHEEATKVGKPITKKVVKGKCYD